MHALHTAISGKYDFQPSSWDCVAWDRVHRSDKLVWASLVARTGKPKKPCMVQGDAVFTSQTEAVRL